jgi:single-strand DNA-binding protein
LKKISSFIEQPRIIYNKEKTNMLNKVILLGNLGAAPEQRATQNGTIVTTFSVATTERWTGKDGQKQEQTEWHRIVTFGRLAEICGQYLTKGSKVYIEGRL